MYIIVKAHNYRLYTLIAGASVFNQCNIWEVRDWVSIKDCLLTIYCQTNYEIQKGMGFTCVDIYLKIKGFGTSLDNILCWAGSAFTSEMTT